jgi:hypothetical protein
MENKTANDELVEEIAKELDLNAAHETLDRYLEKNFREKEIPKKLADSNDIEVLNDFRLGLDYLIDAIPESNQNLMKPVLEAVDALFISVLIQKVHNSDPNFLFNQETQKEIESSIIAKILMRPENFSLIKGLINHNDFKIPMARLCYKAIEEILSSKDFVDILAVQDHLVGNGEFQTEEIKAFLFNSYQNTPSAEVIVSYADALKERALAQSLFTQS